MEADTSLTLTRRGLFQMVLSFLAVAPFASNKSLFGGVQDDVLVADFVDDDDRGVIVHTRGTKLEFFLRSRGIKPAHLARDSGYSRQHLLRIRMGRMEPTRRCIVHIVESCRRLSREPVTIQNLFPGPIAIFASASRAQSTGRHVGASRDRLLGVGRKGRLWSR